MNGPSKKKEMEYQTEDDARTMQRMGEIMADPKRHERAKKKSEDMMAQMEKTKKAMEMMNSAKLEYSKSPKDEK
jgi:hypothetical protein